MRYVIIALVCFITGFVLGGGLSFKVVSDWSADSMYESLESMADIQIDTLKDESGAIYEEKKQQLIDKLNEQKDKMLEDAKSSIKDAINSKIDDFFSFGAKDEEESEAIVGTGN